jgi:ATP-dependent exoDNAse (exonuclease V) alpha subunit
MEISEEKKAALRAFETFFRSKEQRVFLLLGQAGTGKTTLVKIIVAWLKKQERQPVLLATTGRAAKVLSAKTGVNAATVHSCIYVFDELLGNESEDWTTASGQLTLNFDLRKPPDREVAYCYIVDEASMLSHEQVRDHHMAKFGSGSVLDDFMAYTSGRKIVFVGDPCQLPPVAESPFSGALSADFLSERYGVSCTTFELQQVHRQETGNDILESAGHFRRGIQHGHFEKYPKVRYWMGGADIALLPSEEALLQVYVGQIRKDGYQRQILVSNSNRNVQLMNDRIRKLMDRTLLLEPGELLMVVQNSYLVPLVNGDQVIVESVAEHSVRAGIRFMQVVVRELYSGEKFGTLMIADMLWDYGATLSKEKWQALVIDFDKRMRDRRIKRKSEAYEDALRNDKYLNALRAKYGYAITCHKSQGGEWPEVYLLIRKGIYAMQGAQLYRWYYTALTRARERLYINEGWWVAIRKRLQ